MRKSAIISVSLEGRHVHLLDELARRAGSRSRALRMLIEEHERAREQREMEEAYRLYFAQPGAREREREITEEMLPLASWPPEYGAKHGRRRKRPKR